MSRLQRQARLLAGVCLWVVAAAPAASQDLPWPDANPLQSIDGPSRPAAAPARRAPASSRVAQGASDAAVPRPEARPDAAEDAPAADEAATEDDEPADAPDEAPDAPDEPEEAPAEAEDASDEASDEPADAPDEAADTSDEPDDAPDAPDDDPAAEETGDEAAASPQEAAPAAADLPADDIPLPEARPDRAAEPSETPTPAEPAESVPPADAESAEPSPSAIPDALDAPPIPDAIDDPETPATLRDDEPAVTPAASVRAAAAVADAVACEAELAERGVVFTVASSISEGACGVLRPVNVTQLSSGIAVSPDTQMLCRAALALDEWMSDSVVPAAEDHLDGRDLETLRHGSTYVCRTRASERGISEHARGSAIDISAFVFEEGPEIAVEAQAADSPEAQFQRAVRDGACGPFSTVLGPGTDADHATHFHFDIAARRNNATYCR